MDQKRGISRSNAIIGVLLIILVVLGAAYAVTFTAGPSSNTTPTTTSSCKSITSVTYATPFRSSGEFVAPFVALYNGYFLQNCLNVTIVGGLGTAANIQEVAAGTIQFANVQAPIVILDAAKGTVTNVTVVAQENVQPDLACFYLKNGPYNVVGPQSLNGQTVTGGSTFYNQILPAVLKVMGVNANVVPTPEDSGVTLLAQGKLAAWCQGIQNLGEAQDVVTSVNASNSVAYFQPQQYGIDYASKAIIASDSYVSAHPDVVTAFIRAYMEGWIFAYNFPSAATKINVLYNPELQYSAALAQLKGYIPLVFPPSVLTLGLGYFNETAYVLTNNLVKSGYNLTGTMPAPTTIFTTATLPKIIPPAAPNSTRTST